MLFNAEYNNLKQAIIEDDPYKVTSIIQELISTNIKADALEVDDFGDLPYSLITLAVVRARPEILSILLNYGLNPLLEIKDKLPLHFAAQYNKFEHASILVAHGVDVECIGSKNRLSPLYVAEQFGSQETKKLLIQKGAKIDSQNPLDDKKISPQKLKDLLSKHPDQHLKLSELLLRHNFSTSLNGFILGPMLLSKFKSIDFSGLNLNNCVIQITHAEQIDFQEANLSNALIDVQNRLSNLNLNNAMTFNTTFIGEPSLRNHLTKDQYNFCDFLCFNVSDRIKQKELISNYKELTSLHSDGVCFALCIEYIRYTKKHLGYKLFCEKLRRKIDENSDNFSNRILFFQKFSLDAYKLETKELELGQVKNHHAIEKIFDKNNANFIHLKLELGKNFNSHAVLVRRVNNASSSRFTIYDPNLGESALLSEEQANKHISGLVRFYEKQNQGEIKLFIENFEERYEKSIKNVSHSPK